MHFGEKKKYWLNMMYPRLKVARDLLTEDGVIFISIDDNDLFDFVSGDIDEYPL